MTTDPGPLYPLGNLPRTLVVKLGSIARHAEEAMSPNGHEQDAQAIRALLADPQVGDWLRAMDDRALLPVLR